MGYGLCVMRYVLPITRYPYPYPPVPIHRWLRCGFVVGA